MKATGMTIWVPSCLIHSHLQPDLMPDGTPDTGTWTITGTSRQVATLLLTTTDLSCQGVPSHVHLTPRGATGTAHTQSRSSGKQEGSHPNPPSPARPQELLWAEVPLTTPFALGTKSAAKAGLHGPEHVRLPAPHAHSMPLACAQEPRQSGTQMPPLSFTMASKALSQSPHGSRFGLSPVPYRSGNSSSLLCLTYMPVAGGDFSESLTTNRSNRCASPWDSKVTRCLPHGTKLSPSTTTPLASSFLWTPKQCRCCRATRAGSQPAVWCMRTKTEKEMGC